MLNEKKEQITEDLTIYKYIAIIGIFIIGLAMILALLNNFPIIRIWKDISQNTMVQGFSTIFLSIILEALPFIMLGTFASSLIQIFVSEETIKKVIPQNKLFGILCASIIGLVFPICDCAIVPVAKRLLKKGTPVHIVITFMLSVPIVNPIVLASTYYAFANNIPMMLLRGVVGMVSAMLIGFLASKFQGDGSILKQEKSKAYKISRTPSPKPTPACGCGCSHASIHKEKRTALSLINSVIEHTSLELREVGKYIIIGSFLSALMQTFISRKLILFIGQNTIFSVLAMIAFAFFLAVCSETDAFIARSFVGQFTGGSILAFLIFGPMVDIKNTIMLSGAFKHKFVFKLILTIFMVCFTIGIAFNIILLHGGAQWIK